jgi:hypothetical protein
VTDGIAQTYDDRPPERRRPCPLPSWIADRQAADPLQREHIRSPNPSLQKVDLHLRQARSEAMSAIALVVSKSVSADLVVISAPRVFSIVPAKPTADGERSA